MPDPTPRFGLDTFAENESPWSYTDTVEFVDEHAIERGDIGDRPTSGDYVGEFYFAEDELTLYRWNGSSWDVALSLSHSDLTDISSDDHHEKTQPSDINSSNWDDYEIQKNGTDGTGVLNFKT